MPSWLIFDVRQKKEVVAMIAKGWGASLEFTGFPVVRVFDCDGIKLERVRQFTVKKELRSVSEGRVRVMAAACLERKSEGFGRFSRAFSSACLDPKNTPNKAPEPTPGPVTSRAVLISEMSSSRKARLAPSPVVAHL
jgi:hypothetical protein